MRSSAYAALQSVPSVVRRANQVEFSVCLQSNNQRRKREARERAKAGPCVYLVGVVCVCFLGRSLRRSLDQSGSSVSSRGFAVFTTSLY